MQPQLKIPASRKDEVGSSYLIGFGRQKVAEGGSDFTKGDGATRGQGGAWRKVDAIFQIAR